MKDYTWYVICLACALLAPTALAWRFQEELAVAKTVQVQSMLIGEQLLAVEVHVSRVTAHLDGVEERQGAMEERLAQRMGQMERALLEWSAAVDALLTPEQQWRLRVERQLRRLPVQEGQ